MTGMTTDIKAMFLEKEDCDAGTVQRLRDGLSQGAQQYKSLREAVDAMHTKVEAGGPTVTPPTHRGFGTRVMENMIGQLKGEVRFDWRDQGLACEIALPLA